MPEFVDSHTLKTLSESAQIMGIVKHRIGELREFEDEALNSRNPKAKMEGIDGMAVVAIDITDQIEKVQRLIKQVENETKAYMAELSEWAEMYQEPEIIEVE